MEDVAEREGGREGRREGGREGEKENSLEAVAGVVFIGEGVADRLTAAVAAVDSSYQPMLLPRGHEQKFCEPVQV